jgi:hypothetical protein
MLQDVNETILKPVWINTVIEQIVLQKGIPLDDYALCDVINSANDCIREMEINFNKFEPTHNTGFKLKVYSELVARTRMNIPDCMSVGQVVNDVFSYQFLGTVDYVTPDNIPHYSPIEFTNKFMSNLKDENPIPST